MTASNVTDVTELLQAIRNGVIANSDKHQLSEVFLWTLIKEDADKNIRRLDTDYS